MGFFFILHVIICVLLITIILFQDGKAGGLTSVADSSQSVFGARGASSFLTKMTTVFSVLFMISAIALTSMEPPGDRSVAGDFVPTQQKDQGNLLPSGASDGQGQEDSAVETDGPAGGDVDAAAAEAGQNPAPAEEPATTPPPEEPNPED